MGVWWRGESAGRSAAGNWSQRVPESPSQGRGAVGDVSSHLVLGHRGAEERGPPRIPSLEEVGLCRMGQGESPGMLILHGPQSSAYFIRSPSRQQGSLHHRVLLSKAVTVLEEGTFIPLSSQCLHEHTPVASGHRPCTAPLPQLPSKAPSREASSKVWEKKSQQTENLYFGGSLFCSCGRGETGRWGRTGAGHPSPSVVTPAQQSLESPGPSAASRQEPIKGN